MLNLLIRKETDRLLKVNLHLTYFVLQNLLLREIIWVVPGLRQVCWCAVTCPSMGTPHPRSAGCWNGVNEIANLVMCGNSFICWHHQVRRSSISVDQMFLHCYLRYFIIIIGIVHVAAEENMMLDESSKSLEFPYLQFYIQSVLAFNFICHENSAADIYIHTGV